MAVIPLKQPATLIRAGEEDDYGYKAPGDELALKCRYEDRTERVTGQNGVEVVSKGRFYFDKKVRVLYSDTIRAEDAQGIVVDFQPLNIVNIRDLGGKTLLVRVDV